MREKEAQLLALSPLTIPPAGNHIGKDLKSGIFDDIGQFHQFKPEAEIGIVHAEPADCLGIGQARHGKFNLYSLGLLKNPGNEPFHDGYDILAIDKRHFTVNLGEFRLAVGAQVFIAEAADNLEIAVKTGDHEYLFEKLRRLGKRIELPLVDTGRYQKIPGSFRGRLGKEGGLYFEKTVCIQVLPGTLRHL